MIRLQNVRYRYPGAQHDALAGVSWSVDAGETVLLAGRSGSGKSTVLQCLTGLVPHFHGGYFSGTVQVAGRDSRHVTPHDLARHVGYVFQDPEAQIVTDRVDDEIAFTMEQLGVPRREMRRRIGHVGEMLNINHLMDRSTTTLSGGERQMVAIAGAIVHQPQVVILDEPTSQLDADNAERVTATIRRISADSEVTTLIAEHRIERILPIASDIVIVDDGRIRSAEHFELGEPLHTPVPDFFSSDPRSTQGRVLEVSNLSFAFDEKELLADVTFALHPGETVAVSGPNGAGKTTLLKLLCGLLTPSHGNIQIQGRSTHEMSIQDIGRLAGYVPQQPGTILHQETLLDELLFTLRAQRLSHDPHPVPISLDLGMHFGRHPLDLSGGERQRAAISAIGVAQTPILLLDEPTRGLSAVEKSLLAEFLRQRTSRGQTTLIATHDLRFIQETADRTLLIDNGQIRERAPVAMKSPTIREPSIADF